jgi:hypothetical protein
MKKRALRRIKRMLKDPPKQPTRAAAVFVALGGDKLAFKRCKFCQSLRYMQRGVCQQPSCVVARAKERTEKFLDEHRKRRDSVRENSSTTPIEQS